MKQLDKQAVFNEIISDYAEARPGYPAELFEDIIRFSCLEPQSCLLEIGSGPGQATDYFVRNGYAITGLEIGENQVRYLSDKYAQFPNFKAARASFEEYSCQDETYSLIFSATAFHWIIPEVGFPKAHRLLKERGTLAVFWHMSSIVEQQSDEIAVIRQIYRSYAPELDTYISAAEAECLHRLRISQFQADHLFGEPACKVYRWNDEYTTERFLKLERSYSDFHTISEDKRAAVLGGIADYIESSGGKITIPQEVRLYMANKGC